ncbi:heterokaryon incompatibility protein-domain-containing protein, partial [Usnea florida]
YMTLSHCWGTLKCLTLTTLNYKDLETGFKLIELPKTFREAIEITRNLGIRYLWIDALCILQDSHKDWRHEAATMMKVYENSYCNISALAATNSEQGCFFKRPPWCISRTIVETSWDNELNASYDIYPEYFWPVFVDAAPLNSRAWVFQERLLAPRILHYGRNQLFWECLELDACETYPDGLPCTDTVPHSNYRDPGERSLMYKYWHKLVEVYSSRNLTRAEDKLVAISGLAKRVQSCLDDEYLAGLWKGSLPLDLLWYPHWMDGCPRRSSSYRAPTWSWASIE